MTFDDWSEMVKEVLAIILGVVVATTATILLIVACVSAVWAAGHLWGAW